MNDYKFGNFLCELRETKGMTQLELAKMLDITPAAVSKWENGESKPKVETLFKLGEIFGVTAEELMAGEFIVKEEEIITEDRKRYEYHKSLEALLTGRVRITRIFAFIFDWCIVLSIPVVFSFVLFFLFPMQGKTVSDSNHMAIIIFMALGIISTLGVFSFRDFIFKGRSPGKRFFGLVVIDRNSGKAPSKKQLILRNLFFVVDYIDGIIMLIRGISIGDSVAQTFVVSKEQLENKDALLGNVDSINSYVSPNKENRRVKVSLVAGVVLFLIFFSVVVYLPAGLEKSEPYQVAYNYLVESESFKELNVSEKRVKWKSISGIGIIAKGDTNNVTFLAEGKEFTVVSHLENGEWIVCKKCTPFE